MHRPWHPSVKTVHSIDLAMKMILTASGYPKNYIVGVDGLTTMLEVMSLKIAEKRVDIVRVWMTKTRGVVLIYSTAHGWQTIREKGVGPKLRGLIVVIRVATAVGTIQRLNGGGTHIILVNG